MSSHTASLAQNQVIQLQQLIDDLQMKIAFLDDTVELLNQKIAKQDKEIIDLNRKMQMLYQRVEHADLSEGVAPFDPMLNIPPHY